MQCCRSSQCNLEFIKHGNRYEQEGEFSISLKEMLNNVPSYFLVTACLFTFMVGPSSPPGRLNSGKLAWIQILHSKGYCLNSRGCSKHEDCVTWSPLEWPSTSGSSEHCWLPPCWPCRSPPGFHASLPHLDPRAPLGPWLHCSPGPEPSPWRHCLVFLLVPLSRCRPTKKECKNCAVDWQVHWYLIVISSTSTARVRKQETNFCLSPSNNTYGCSKFACTFQKCKAILIFYSLSSLGW